MRKLYSLIKASMTSNMSLFKIKTKSNSKSAILVPLFIALYLMFMVWSGANSMFEKLEPFGLQHLLLSLFAFGVSLFTFIEGIYKSGSLMFNCKDDQLLLSLPIKRRTVLFVRIFKFYIFELTFNSMFLFPTMLAYVRWGNNISFSYLLTCIVMLLLLPIIPIVLASVLGAVISYISGKFKHKNIIQIIISMLFLVIVLYFSFSMNGVTNYITENATNINNVITKLYYPAGLFAKLVVDFNIMDLIIFILINLVIFVLFILILGKFYFKINSRLKSINISSNKKVTINDIKVKRDSKIKSLIKKEINTFFRIPVFIINAGFALVLFIIATIIISIKFDSVIPLLTSEELGLGITLELINNNISVFILGLILITSFMTSITNSVISLEGKNISILKSLPVKTKTILMGKVYAALLITTPVLLVGDIILFVRFKVNLIEMLLLVLLSILVPLISHFIGIIVNLKYPKFEWESSSEVVKQSISSFVSVMIGMLLFIISISIILYLVGKIHPTLLLSLSVLLFLVIDIVLYTYLNNKGVKKFNDFTV